jgi:glycine betaine catabolism B
MKSPLLYIDRFLNGIAMYRLTMYAISVIAAIAILLGFFGVLSYDGPTLVLSATIVIATCYVANFLFSKIVGAVTNNESAFITGGILFLIISPMSSGRDAVALVLAGVIAMASKYVFAWKKRHIFNPAAFAAFILGFTPFAAATWWVGSVYLLPVAIVVGFLVVRKIRRFSLVLSCIFASVIVASIYAATVNIPVPEYLSQLYASWPLIFMATIMLTEPFTTPPQRNQRIAYGALVGAISSWPLALNLGLFTVYGTPEFALLVGNVFSYYFNLKRRLILTLQNAKEIAKDTRQFSFASTSGPILFKAGQYLEWTLPHSGADMRGVRRYFTIASSPTENDIKLGVKFAPKSSTFKQNLLSLKEGNTIIAGQLAGDFVLPKEENKKLVFIAGGIGITPFRSMTKYILDSGEKRDIVLFYSSKTYADIAYTDLFTEAAQRINLRSIYLVNEKEGVPAGFPIEVGFITPDMIKNKVPDYMERVFYLSGPDAMVTSYKKLLRGMGVARKNIKTDYFPGFA